MDSKLATMNTADLGWQDCWALGRAWPLRLLAQLG